MLLPSSSVLRNLWGELYAQNPSRSDAFPYPSIHPHHSSTPPQFLPCLPPYPPPHTCRAAAECRPVVTSSTGHFSWTPLISRAAGGSDPDTSELQLPISTQFCKLCPNPPFPRNHLIPAESSPFHSLENPHRLPHVLLVLDSHSSTFVACRSDQGREYIVAASTSAGNCADL